MGLRFAEQTVCFTGRLQYIDRKDAFLQMVVREGGHWEANLTKNVTLLVVGGDRATGSSAVEKKARAYNAVGASIRILSEKAFRDTLAISRDEALALIRSKNSKRLMALTRALDLVAYAPAIDLRGADLRGADLRRLPLQRALLDGADLSRAKIMRGTYFHADGVRNVRFDAAELPAPYAHAQAVSDTSFVKARLTKARFSYTDFERVNFSGAKLVGADLRSTKGRAVDFTRADLTGAKLSKADLADARFVQATLARANLSGAKLTRADFTGADLRGADLTGADLKAAKIDGARLDGAKLELATLPAALVPKGPRAALTADQVLAVLDMLAKSFDFPVLDNGYVYPAGTRLSGFSDGKSWALAIQVVGYNYRGTGHAGMHTAVYYAGPGVVRGSGIDTVTLTADAAAGETFDAESRLSPQAKAVMLRGKRVPLPGPDDYRRAGVKLKKGRTVAPQDLLRALVHLHPQACFESEKEISRRIRRGLPRILDVAEWRHPDVAEGELPSRSEAFRLIAAALAEVDAALYAPRAKPNTHWSNWPGAGTL